jgi:hypothetical protein
MLARKKMPGGSLLYRFPRGIWYTWSQTRMRSTLIVVADPLFEQTPQVPLVNRDQEVQAFAANCTDQSLTERVGMSVQLRRMAMLKFDVSE